jgi:hypothetical protein
MGENVAIDSLSSVLGGNIATEKRFKSLPPEETL